MTTLKTVLAATAAAAALALAAPAQAAGGHGGGGGGGGGGHGGGGGGGHWSGGSHGGGGHWGGSGGHWHGGGYYHGGYYGGWYWGWPLLWSAAYWGYPYYYGYPYYAAYPYYNYDYPPAVYPGEGAYGENYQPPATTTVQPNAPGAPTRAPAYLNYCESAKAYYPKVNSCPEGWRFEPAH